MAEATAVPSLSLTPAAELVGHADRVWHSAWHPSGTLLATCGGDRSVRIWQPKGSSLTVSASPSASVAEAEVLNPSWSCVCVLEDFTVRTVRRCEWSPDGKLLACASFDGKVTVWHFAAAPPPKHLPKSEGESAGATGSDDGAEDFAGIDSSSSSSSTDKRGRSILKGELVATLEGHENEVKAVCWNHDGSLLATCGRDKSVWVWMLASPEAFDFEVLAVLHGHSQDVKALAWHPTRDLLLSASYDDSIKVWGESSDGDWVCAQTLMGHGSTVWQVCFGPSASSANSDGATEGEGEVASVIGHGDSRCFASVSDDCKLILWDGRSPSSSDVNENPHAIDDLLLWRQARCIEGIHDRTIFSVDWSTASPSSSSPSSSSSSAGAAATGSSAGIANRLTSTIATVGADDRLVFYRPSAAPSASAMAVDGAGEDGDAASHDPATASLLKGSPSNGADHLRSFAPVAVIERAHSADVNSVRWHPHHSNLLATTGDDGLVKLWQLRL